MDLRIIEGVSIWKLRHCSERDCKAPAIRLAHQGSQQFSEHAQQPPLLLVVP